MVHDTCLLVFGSINADQDVWRHISMVGVTAPDPCVTFNLALAEVPALTRDRKGAKGREDLP